MKARQVVVLEPYKVGVREVELPPPAANQILVAAEVSAVSAGTELAVYTGTHQWLKDPNLPDWKFPFRPGYSAAGTVVAVGSDVKGWKAGRPRQLSRQSRLGGIADARPRTRPAVALPPKLDAEKAALPASPATASAPRSAPASRWAARRPCWGWASSASSPCAA